MGFYSPGKIVKDAERHGVEVLPARVDASDWDCTLEGQEPDPALRLGLRLVSGLGEEPGRRIEAARRERPFATVEDLVGEGGSTSGRSRRWRTRGRSWASAWSGARRCGRCARRGRRVFRGDGLGDAMPAFAAAVTRRAAGARLRDDGCLGGRPRDEGRPPASARHLQEREGPGDDARRRARQHGGIVICRQRPGTASGVVFVTMEDETGFVNLILWSQTFEKWRHVATTSSMLVAHGKVERQGEVVYVVPDRLEKLTMLDAPAMSRDFTRACATEGLGPGHEGIADADSPERCVFRLPCRLRREGGRYNSAGFRGRHFRRLLSGERMRRARLRDSRQRFRFGRPRHGSRHSRRGCRGVRLVVL